MLPPDIQYCFDCAIECANITPDVWWYYNVLADRQQVIAWFDGVGVNYSNNGFAASAQQNYEFWYENYATPEQQAALCVAGLLGLKNQVNDLGHFAAEKSVRDKGVGKRQTRSLMSARFPARFIKSRASISIKIDNLQRLMQRTSNLSEAVRAKAADDYNEILNKGWDQLVNDENSLRRESMISIITSYKPKLLVTKKQKKALVRSTGVLGQLLGKQTAEAFISGDEVTIKGQKFDFIIRAKNILRNDWSGHTVVLTDKDGVVLTNLCFYFDNTPAPEQLAGIALHVMCGEEDKIIEAANFYKITSAGNANPNLQKISSPRQLALDADVTRICEAILKPEPLVEVLKPRFVAAIWDVLRVPKTYREQCPSRMLPTQ